MKTKTTKLTADSTVEDFINFFKAIPAKKWCIREFTSPKDKTVHCARGHVIESSTIGNLGSRIVVDHHLCCIANQIVYVNNGPDIHFPQKSIKARVLAYLKSLV